ncbi:hypothetical protein GCM10028808_39720 [Spirosoma migulaei]
MAYKLFIFAIGGTGSRVVKALTMLLASGMELKDVSEVIPIIVDPHKANEDLKRTENLLKTYKRIREGLKDKPKAGEFFGTSVRTLNNIVSQSDKMADTYTFELKGVTNEKFEQYIEYGNLDPANKALASLLFSSSNLSTEMDIGFVGNPNIGSVVLNQFAGSDEFRQFAANFNPEDRVFIISSIFGGTGAAGFPIILKNIRAAQLGDGGDRVDNPENLRNARIGALTVLPYFGLEPNAERRVDKATFYSKTKAALHYYGRGVNKSVNKLYYLGDRLTKNFAYDPGENGQRNDAHLIELAGALTIVDFANLPDNALETENGKPVEPVCAEFGLRQLEETVSFGHFDPDTLQVLARPLSRMALFSMYLTYRIASAAGGMDWTKTNPKIDNGFLSGQFVRTYLGDFNTQFQNWLTEMAANKRGFQPFLYGDNLEKVIIGYKVKRNFPGLSSVTFSDMDTYLNAVDKKEKTFSSPEDKLVQVLNRGINQFLTERYPDLFKTIPS